MSIHQIHVFISHSWKYSNHYEKLAEWIFQNRWTVDQASLDFRNFSVPKDDPIHNAANDAQLKQAIFTQIRMSHVIVIPTGMYANYSKWIQKEIEGARQYSKPILAVNPWAQEKKASTVAAVASATVGWNSQPVVGKIWELYRNA